MTWVLNQYDLGNFSISIGYDSSDSDCQYENIENIVDGDTSTYSRITFSKFGSGSFKIYVRIYPYEGVSTLSILKSISYTLKASISTQTITRYYNGESTQFLYENPITINGAATYIDYVIEGSSSASIFSGAVVYLDIYNISIPTTLKRGQLRYRDESGNVVTLADIGSVGDSVLRYFGTDSKTHKVYLTNVKGRNVSDVYIRLNNTIYYPVVWDG